VLVIDRGGYAVVRPVPTDPIAALRGAHAGDEPSIDDARAAERAADIFAAASRPGVVTVLDAAAVLALLRDESAADEVEALLRHALLRESVVMCGSVPRGDAALISCASEGPSSASAKKESDGEPTVWYG
jgi:hypothetical protein